MSTCQFYWRDCTEPCGNTAAHIIRGRGWKMLACGECIDRYYPTVQPTTTISFDRIKHD